MWKAPMPLSISRCEATPCARNGHTDWELNDEVGGEMA